MLHAVPRNVSYTHFHFQRDEKVLAELAASRWGWGWGWGATMTAGPERCRLRRQGFLWRRFALEQGTDTVAWAIRSGALRSDFSLEASAGRFQLRRTSRPERRFGVMDAEQEVGSIHQDRETRWTRIDLPSAWPLGEQVFAFWLALQAWTAEDAG